MSGRYAGSVALVTGGQGFIGSHLVERLLVEGARVVVPRRDVPARSYFRLAGLERRCDLADLDLLDAAAVLRVLNEHEVEHVFHLAAQAIVAVANRSPASTFESNVRATWNLLEACRDLGERGPLAIVVASSDKAYGAQDELPYREDMPLRAVHPYDVSKACADLVARSYAHSFALPVAVTRLANVYGPGDLSFSRLVPDTARTLVRGERPVVRSDGTPLRDFLHVEDAVAAYLAVADSLATRPELRGRAWNAGADAPVAVLDLVRRLIFASGRSVEPDVRGRGVPSGEIDRQWLDSSAIRAQLGWAPSRELDEGLVETYAWYAENLSESVTGE
ncbi:MAG: UDP-glucose 4-epimerase [uncultured Solirubrobacterales bacterium]|uniref:UDP-glucose 4-epimerase n=1 Tax=uncultured Solirubrobacterales bacterium TaxID=768556 RepID=A0A6J4T3I6_9ACTN|nr:MAG: UDP-glucose 4-epimerase [uncultured Solirubrobacterales bacterium]